MFQRLKERKVLRLVLPVCYLVKGGKGIRTETCCGCFLCQLLTEKVRMFFYKRFPSENSIALFLL